MSRGLGKIQRRILEVLQAEKGLMVPSPILAALVYMSGEDEAKFRQQVPDREIQFLTLGLMNPPPLKQVSAVRRACNRLYDEGLIEGYVLHDMPNMRAWAIPKK